MPPKGKACAWWVATNGPDAYSVLEKKVYEYVDFAISRRVFGMELYILEGSILSSKYCKFPLAKLLFTCFDYVEIDSSSYRIPNVFMVNNWITKTPKNFKFTAKFPRVITHEKRLKDVSKELEHLFEVMGPLSSKTLALLIQLPPSLHIREGLECLREIVPDLDTRFRYAVEVRHTSWFQDLAYNFFSNNDICLVWSQLAEIQTPPIVTTDFLYLRLIGDRSIQEKDFGRIQIDRIADMQKWADSIKNVHEDEDIKLAIVTANNHYAGFAPGTVNIGLPEAKLEGKEEEIQKQEVRYPTRKSKQRTLSEFMELRPVVS